MKDIMVRSNNIEIYAEKSWEYSFFSSPYPAHREFSAVDIYQGTGFGGVALSPVTGEVSKTLRFDSPSLGKPLPEYLILIKTGDYLARIMHVKPTVKAGDVLHAGDELGRFIKNGYFFFWVDAGMHVEVRDPGDYLRARGGCELEPVLREKVTAEKPVPELRGVVVDASKRNITVRLNKSNAVKIREEYTIMDCATSLGYGGVLGRFSLGDEIYFNGIGIGKIDKVGAYMSTFKTTNLKIFADDMEFRGISFMLGRDVARLLPPSYGSPALKAGDQVKVRLEVEKQ